MVDGHIDLSVEKLQTSEGVRTLNNMLSRLFDLVAGDGNTVKMYSDYGTPESNVVAGIGSIYMRKDGGASTTVYIKESGTEATGWVAK